jgi:phage-related protein
MPVEIRAKLSRILELMQEVGPQELREPHVKSLGQKLMEILLTGNAGIAKIIYVTKTNKKTLLLHAFRKKTQKTPIQALECAFRRLKEIDDEHN